MNTAPPIPSIFRSSLPSTFPFQYSQSDIQLEYIKSIIKHIPTFKENMEATVKKTILYNDKNNPQNITIIRNHRNGKRVRTDLNMNDPNFKDQLLTIWNATSDLLDYEVISIKWAIEFP